MKELFKKYIDAPLKILDGDDFFRNGFFYMTSLLALGIALMGSMEILGGFFGNYLERIMDRGGFLMVRSLMASFLTIVISFVVLLGVVGILVKRARDMREAPYTSLIGFASREMVPTAIKAYAEICALFPIALALYTLISVCFVAIPFFPLGDAMFEALGLMTIMDGLGNALLHSYQDLDGIGDYVGNMGTALVSLIGAVLASFAILVINYGMLEIYRYVLSLTTNLIGYLPRFAIPVWVQRSERSQS